ncbi:MAG: MBL fold metallo-hydrolase [Candidatus Geothermincolia bacterium]
MLLKTLRVGMLGTNCYIVAAEGSRHAAVVDPGGDPKKIIAGLAEAGLACSHILCTHGHMDHVAAVGPLAEASGAEVYIHDLDAAGLGGRRILASVVSGVRPSSPERVVSVKDGDELEVSGLRLRVLHTPGHTRGSVSFHVGDELFCGDLIFSGSIGRTDLAGGSMRDLLDGVREKVFVLPERTRIYPGHGPATTIADERARNPYLKDL